MSPRPDVSAERKLQIFQAALSCFGRKGYHRTTMDDIAAESGMSKGALYWYFSSKRELFLALFQETMTHFGKAWEAVLARETKTATEKLLATMALFRSELKELVPFIGILMEAWALIRHDEDVEKLSREYYQPYVDAMTKLIREGISRGEFVVDSAEDAALMIMILYDGINLALGTGLVDTDWDRLMDAAEAMVLGGLGAKS
jgi:AcrR family transcriptional regulator